MRQAIFCVTVLLFVFSFATFTPVFAEENEVMALKNEVKDLNAKVAELESLVKNMQGHISATQGKEFTAPQAVAPGETVPGGFVRTAQDIHMGGYVDVQYNNNLSSETTNLGGNPLRSFDNDQDTFGVNAVELNFQKEANPEGGVGFRADIAMGEDAEVVDATGPSAGSLSGTDMDEFSIQQAYVELVAPLKFFEGNKFLGDTVKLKMGRMVTLAGAEVIEAPDNWNASRSFLFGLAIPFTHTGVRAEYGLWDDRITTFLGVNNGWDNVIDNNTYKTVEGGFTAKILDNLTWTAATYFGPENATQAGHKRFLLTNVFLWEATDKLKFMGEIDFGSERRVPGLQGLDFENAQWHGYAGYARYQLTDKWAGAYRIEFFRDDDTFRTASSADNSLWEQTFTAERLIYDNMIARLEYRLDRADDLSLFNGESSQSTLNAQLIYKFA